jgi:hypothetical protein
MRVELSSTDVRILKDGMLVRSCARSQNSYYAKVWFYKMGGSITAVSMS